MTFYGRDYYRSKGNYSLLPFRFMRWPDNDVLVVNDVGESLFLGERAFADFVGHNLDRASSDYGDLKARHFLRDTDSDVPLDLLATKYRTKMAFLDSFTSLHLFVVTLRCDHSCRYCQVSRVTEDRIRYDMSRDTALRAIDLAFRSPSPALKIEFQGGEPLLNFDLVRFIVTEVERRNQTVHRDLAFVVATNLAPLTDEMLTFFAEHKVQLSTSLDGPEWLHNQNRPRRNDDSYAVTVRNLERARCALGEDAVSALMTTTVLPQSERDRPFAVLDTAWRTCHEQAHASSAYA